MTDSDSITGASLPSIPELLYSGVEPFHVYAVVDAAKVPVLLDVLQEHAYEGACLLPGRLEPDVAAAAPYVLLLERGTRLTDWLLEGYWHSDALIVLQSEQALGAVMRHLRRLTVAKLPGGDRAYFRFYDPRVLRAYLPTCTEEERAAFFGDVVLSLWADAGNSSEPSMALEFDSGVGAGVNEHPLAVAE